MTTTLARLASPFSTDIAIGLGTANTLVHITHAGVLVSEPSVVAIEESGNARRVLAVGREAKMMVGETPTSILAHRPMPDGLIADFSDTEAMIGAFIARVSASGPCGAAACSSRCRRGSRQREDGSP